MVEARDRRRFRLEARETREGDRNAIACCRVVRTQSIASWLFLGVCVCECVCVCFVLQTLLREERREMDDCEVGRRTHRGRRREGERSDD